LLWISSLALLFLLLFSTPLYSQNPPTTSEDQLGMQPYQSYHGGDIDVINLTTGTLNLNVPFLNYPQRGKLHFSFNLFYNNEAQNYAQQCLPHLTCKWIWGYTPNITPLPVEFSDAFVASAQQVGVVGSDYGAVVSPNTTWYGNWSLQTADGSKHPLGI
jgi:hypothetical protein